MEAYHTSTLFLNDAKEQAKKRGYNPNKLFLAKDGVHKLTYYSPEGIRHFGRRHYGDYLFYKRYKPSIANKKKSQFRASHSEITKIHDLDKYSANELAINILW